MDEYLKVAKEAALKAGKMLWKNFKEAREIYFKGEINLVTHFDTLSQNMIFEHLSASFPDHGFLAEEDLSKERGAEFLWLIDPIDGTTNFAHKFPVFCVSIALEKKGKIVLGIVYDPTRDEMFWAVEGGGSFLNGEKIRVSSVDDLGKGLVATGFPYDIRESEINNIDHFNNFAKRVQAIRRCGSAAMDLCYVACGRFDGFWELKLSPWDVAAGALIVKESGGQISDFQNADHSIYGLETLATNGLIHRQMIDILQLGKQMVKIEK